MSSSDIEKMLDGMAYKIVSYGKEEVYATTGSACHNADIILQGEMVVRMSGLSGRLVEVTRLRQGDIIGFCFLYSENERLPATVEAATSVRVMRLTRETLRSLVNNDERIRWNFVRMLSDMSSFLSNKIRVLSLMTVKEKIMFLLKREMKRQGSRTIMLNTSRQRIADAFAIQKFSLLRCLSELVEQGIISIKGRAITVLDMGRL